MSARLSASAFVLALAAAAFAQPASAIQEDGSAAASAPASIIVFDQKLDGSGVEVSYVYAPDKSFAVIYGSDENGQRTGKALGTLALDAGDHRDINIPLPDGVKSGDALWVSLYRVKDGGAEFDSTRHVSYWTGESLPSTNGFIIR